MYNYKSLLNMNYHRRYILILILFLLILLIFISFIISFYSHYNAYSISDGNYLLIDVPIDNSDALKKGKHIKIDNKKYDYELVEISQVKNNGIINYQTYKIDVKNKFKKNMVLKTTFYYHRDKVINKIKNVVF